MAALRIFLPLQLTIGLSLVGSLSAQPSVAGRYDVTKTMIVEGMLIGMAFPPHMDPTGALYLLVEKQDVRSQGERWAFEIQSLGTLKQSGWTVAPQRGTAITGPHGTLKYGDLISVVAYRAKPNVDLAIPAIPQQGSALERVHEVAKIGRLAYGIDVTVPDGAKLKLGASR
jgi:hypothetical protein